MSKGKQMKLFNCSQKKYVCLKIQRIDVFSFRPEKSITFAPVFMESLILKSLNFKSLNF